MRKNDQGVGEFRDQDGSLIPAAGQLPRYRGNIVAHLKEKLEDRIIDRLTIRPEWHGETMDRDLAVVMLWDLTHHQTFPR